MITIEANLLPNPSLSNTLAIAGPAFISTSLTATG